MNSCRNPMAAIMRSCSRSDHEYSHGSGDPSRYGDGSHEVPAHMDKPAVVQAVEPNSPAERAGIEPATGCVRVDALRTPNGGTLKTSSL
jgi:S1-C subfamily serine protease